MSADGSGAKKKPAGARGEMARCARDDGGLSNAAAERGGKRSTIPENTSLTASDRKPAGWEAATGNANP